MSPIALETAKFPSTLSSFNFQSFYFSKIEYALWSFDNYIVLFLFFYSPIALESPIFIQYKYFSNIKIIFIVLPDFLNLTVSF